MVTYRVVSRCFIFKIPTSRAFHSAIEKRPPRFRERLGIKQETLAQELGDDWTQSKVSRLETKDTVDPAILEQVAWVLKVPVEAIKNFDEEAAVSYINTFHDNSTSHVIGNYGTYNFNPIDKWMELLEENRRLYEALLKEKDEKIAMLEKQLAKKEVRLCVFLS